MTLPFRRRHHDDESTHDRARALTSAQMLDALAPADEAWLGRHLEACAECRRDREAFLADRDLLRSLRTTTPEPPRDLWARTSAAIEVEARRKRRIPAAGRPAAPSGSARPRWSAFPIGAAAGVLVLVVVLGSVFFPGQEPSTQSAAPASDRVGIVTPGPQPQATNLAITADRVGWIRSGADGSWELVFSDIDEVCPQAKPGCENLGAGQVGQQIDLGAAPDGITISPNEDQLVVEQRGDVTQPGQVYVVPVPTATPATTPEPTDPGTETHDPGFSLPIETPLVSPEATPGSSPDNGVLIATGVAMVGEAAYSADGDWLAFSARPSDGSTGPDLYLWRVGDESALPVTSDHATYFSSWLDDQVLASRVAPASAEPPAEGETDGESPAPTKPGKGEGGKPESSGKPAPAESPIAGPSEAPAAASEAHPISFLLDPETGTQTDLASPDVWLPVVDPSGHFVAYWSGTVVLSADGLDWQLGSGDVVLDGWTADPDTEPAATADPDASPVAAGPGPSGNPVVLVKGPAGAYKAKFDPDGTRLAVWVAESATEDQGRLQLIVLDPETGAIDTGKKPLGGEPALGRFSIDNGRLAWVTPPGQDGQDSSVQVLGWKGDDFGEIQTIPARDLFIVR